MGPRLDHYALALNALERRHDRIRLGRHRALENDLLPQRAYAVRAGAIAKVDADYQGLGISFRQNFQRLQVVHFLALNLTLCGLLLVILFHAGSVPFFAPRVRLTESVT